MEMLQKLQKQVITQLEEIIKYAEEHQLTNTQEFINFLDKINELSVSH